MYSIQSLWTAANMKLPITFVIANNGGYRIIKQRLLAFHGNAQFVGMDFNDPYIDFTMMAQSLGVPGSASRIPATCAARSKNLSRRRGRNCSKSWSTERFKAERGT